MTYSILLAPEVERDVLAAVRWYDQWSELTGQALLDDFYGAVTGLVDFPFRWNMVDDPVRRLLLRRFPFAGYYVVDGGRIIVLGLFHCARDPVDVRETLRERTPSDQ